MCFSYNFFIVLLLFFPFHVHAYEDNLITDEVVFYNWYEYIPEGVLDAFEKETGLKVIYKTYEKPGVMSAYMTALNARAFDVVVAPTNYVEKFASKGLLRSIDHNEIDFSKINKDLLNRKFDLGNRFSIPFIWGSTSLFYDKAKITDEIVRWSDLWKPGLRNRVLLPNYPNEIFPIVLKMLGYSGNSENPDEIKQAYQVLLKLIPNIKLVSQFPDEDLLQEGVDIGVAWNGDVLEGRAKKAGLNYVYPEEGSYFWIDNLVISANAPNLKNAYILINYLLRPEVAVKWTTELGYANAIIATKTLLDDNIRNDQLIFPPADAFKKVEFTRNVPEAQSLYKLYWVRLLKKIAEKVDQTD